MSNPIRKLKDKNKPKPVKCAGCKLTHSKYIQEYRNEVILNEATKQMSIQRISTAYLICPSCGTMFVPPKQLGVMRKLAFGEKSLIIQPDKANIKRLTS